MKKTTHNASKTTITGRVTLEGVRTTFNAGGVSVADQKVILKLEKGLLSKRFWLPIEVLKVDAVNKALARSSQDDDPVILEMTLQDVTKIDNRFRTFAANLLSVSVPLTDDALRSLVSSNSLTSDPKQPAK